MGKNRTGPVEIRGQVYANQTAAAAALGVTRAAVNIALRTGKAATVGLGLRGNQNGASNRRITTIRGVTYESRAAAAQALGLSLSQLSTFLSVAAELNINVN
jgi:type IV secretory pathway TrbL component